MISKLHYITQEATDHSYIEMIEERDYSNNHWKKEETSHADWLKGYWKRKTNT